MTIEPRKLWFAFNASVVAQARDFFAFKYSDEFLLANGRVGMRQGMI